ncbi:bacteriohemerythrin [Alicyclobacillus ferrooxydans]|uniref:Hemerythrin-like domain-containing protein n=1 Tax=Alicyclobacillus ferrooxydans TaxID=471514 RepID=A0A0N8PP18_9BACL|nr:bacteriohemerythrin [Alicyclobacillus ferrooxydans]KPV43085.1 hypothetical protein AN477_14215 [Alicyclobacillus ferrooxydans]
MALVTWDEKYSVGNGMIDKQHHSLVDLINQLHDAMKEGKSKEKVKPTLDALLKYTKEHFTYEEQRMQAANYPLFSEHKKQHEGFVAKVESFITDYNSGKAGLNFSIINFLKDWLLNHIAESDKKYRSYMQG